MNTCSELALVDLQVDVPERVHLVVADLVTPGHLLEPDHGRHAGTVPRVWLVLHVDAHASIVTRPLMPAQGTKVPHLDDIGIVGDRAVRAGSGG